MASTSKITKTFKIEGPENRDIGTWRIRLSKTDRLGADRHCLLRITHADQTGYFIGLGHEKGNGIAQMDFDVREHLGINGKGVSVSLEVELIKGWRGIIWYLKHRDPYIYVPAYVGVLSLAMGLIGVGFGAISLIIAFCE